MCELALQNNNYPLCEELGRGRFGTIYRCFCATTNTFFAVKSINKSLLVDPTDRECLENEPKIMSLLSPHPNIVQIHDSFDSPDSLALVLELCEPYTLYDIIIKSSDKLAEPQQQYSEVTNNGCGFLGEQTAAVIIKQLLTAVAHCHRFGVVHRDIKPENVLFDNMNRVKLADFGSAAVMSGDGQRRISGVVGTPYYVAPEVVMGREYNEKVDVWSVGVVLYVMLAGIPPFYGETVEEIFEAVVRANLRFPPRIFRNVSPAAKDLLRKMICRDVSRRISAEQALWHPWILNGGVATAID